MERNGTAAAPLDLFHATGATCSISSLGRAASGAGFFNVIPDDDGVLRRVPLLMEYQGKLFPSLSLATLMHARQIKQAVLQTSSGRLESIVLSDISIPVDSKANFLVRYRDARAPISHFSALDIMQDAVARKSIEGKIVFLGASAVGLEEYRTTPLAAAVPGTEIHATIVDNILKKEFFYRPYWAPGFELLLVLFLRRFFLTAFELDPLTPRRIRPCGLLYRPMVCLRLDAPDQRNFHLTPVTPRDPRRQLLPAHLRQILARRADCQVP